MNYRSFQCQRCGDYIGWLGRFIDFVLPFIDWHKCNKRGPSAEQGEDE